MNEEQIPEIKKGIVIDHVPPERGYYIYKILSQYIRDGATIKLTSNIPSNKIGKKWVFKIEELIDDERFYDILALAGGKDITINIIDNGGVAKKFHPQYPETIEGLLKCPNSQCVTNNDYHAGQRQEFHLVSAEPLLYQCKYCGTMMTQKNIDELLQKGF